MALSLLKIFQEKILSLHSFEEVYEFMDTATKTLNDSTSLIFSLIFKKYEFDENFINNNRASLETGVVENLRKCKEKSQQLMSLKYKKSSTGCISNHFIKCNIEWPICLYDTESRSEIINFLVLQPFLKELDLKDDYFENNKSYSNSGKLSQSSIYNTIQNNDYRNLLIERKAHLCENLDLNQDIDQDSKMVKKVDEIKKVESECKKSEFPKKIKQSICFTPEYDKFIFEINSKCK